MCFFWQGAGSEGGDGGAVTLSLEDIEEGVAAPLFHEDGSVAITASRRMVLDDIDWNVISLVGVLVGRLAGFLGADVF